MAKKYSSNSEYNLLSRTIVEETLDTNPFEKISNIVLKELESAIITSQFSPGQKLSVSQIAEAMNVSPTPVWEAIERLQQLGLVVTEPIRNSRRKTYHVFNMSKAEFMGQRVLIDNFGELTGCVAALVDREWFMVFDNMLSFTENYNGEGLYWNYFYHVWKTFSTSPFANALIFTTDAQSITKVTVTGPAALKLGEVGQYVATVEGTPLAPQGVVWTVTGTAPVKSMIDWTGKLLVPPDETNTELTVKATSVYDPAKSGTITVTISAP